MAEVGTNELLTILLVIFIIVLLLSVLNQAKSLEESMRNRVKDIIVLGLILWFSPSAKIAGMVIYL